MIEDLSGTASDFAINSNAKNCDHLHRIIIQLASRSDSEKKPYFGLECLQVINESELPFSSKESRRYET